MATTTCSTPCRSSMSASSSPCTAPCSPRSSDSAFRRRRHNRRPEVDQRLHGGTTTHGSARPTTHPRPYSGMRLFTCGSAPLSEAAFDDFTRRTGHRICERYGMSETGITVSNPYDGDRSPGSWYPFPGSRPESSTTGRNSRATTSACWPCAVPRSCGNTGVDQTQPPPPTPLTDGS